MTARVHKSNLSVSTGSASRNTTRSQRPYQNHHRPLHHYTAHAPSDDDDQQEKLPRRNAIRYPPNPSKTNKRKQRNRIQRNRTMQQQQQQQKSDKSQRQTRQELEQSESQSSSSTRCVGALGGSSSSLTETEDSVDVVETVRVQSRYRRQRYYKRQSVVDVYDVPSEIILYPHRRPRSDKNDTSLRDLAGMLLSHVDEGMNRGVYAGGTGNRVDKKQKSERKVQNLSRMHRLEDRVYRKVPPPEQMRMKIGRSKSVYVTRTRWGIGKN